MKSAPMIPKTINIMKSKQEVEKGLYELFSQFVHRSITDEFFIRKLEQLCKGGKDQSWWWRYFPGDTAASTPKDVAHSLRVQHNRVYALENMQYTLEHKSLIVYYS